MKTSLKVLLVEDNLHSRILFGTALRKSGHHVIEAPSGEKALLVCTLHEPDIILLDIGLPGMSGLGVASTLVGDSSRKRCPIIAITGMELSDDAVLAAGIDAVFYKPITPFELVERMMAWWAEYSGEHGAGNGN